MNQWLYTIGLNNSQIKTYFCYSALVNHFPGSKDGSRRVPSSKEIAKEKQRLMSTIINFDPDIVVTVGRLSLSHCLNTPLKNLSDHIGKYYQVNPYNLLSEKKMVIPLPHPSGASTWRHKPGNQLLLRKALFLLKTSLGI